MRLDVARSIAYGIEKVLDELECHAAREARVDARPIQRRWVGHAPRFVATCQTRLGADAASRAAAHLGLVVGLNQARHTLVEHLLPKSICISFSFISFNLFSLKIIIQTINNGIFLRDVFFIYYS